MRPETTMISRTTTSLITEPTPLTTSPWEMTIASLKRIQPSINVNEIALWLSTFQLMLSSHHGSQCRTQGKTSIGMTKTCEFLESLEKEALLQGVQAIWFQKINESVAIASARPYVESHGSRQSSQDLLGQVQFTMLGFLHRSFVLKGLESTSQHYVYA